MKEILTVSELEKQIESLTLLLKADGPTSREIRIHHLMKSLNEQLSTIKKQPKGTGQLTEKTGGLLEAEETYLVHQCNCIWQKPKGLAETMFEHFPDADVYKQRRKGLRKPDIPGSTSMHSRVVNFYGQINPGKPDKDDLFRDTRQGRLNWFINCLDQLRKHLQDHEGVSIAFPKKI